MKKKMTREEWLNKLAGKMQKQFKKHIPLLPKFRVSCGFTSAGTRGDVIGECWFPKASEDSTTEIFIKPDQAKPEEVAAVLCHELIHAALGPKAGHGKDFSTACKKLGLEGPATATTGGPDFLAWIKPLIKACGPYPHAKLNAMERAPWRRKQPTKSHVNLRCPSCDYYAKTTREMLAVGRLKCPADGETLLTAKERAK